MSDLQEFNIFVPINAVQQPPLTDAKYLEMAEDMKRVVDRKDLEIERYKREAQDYKKAIMSVYGLVLYVEEMFEKIEIEELFPIDLGVNDLMGIIRAKLEKKIL